MAKRVLLTADSACDLNAELTERYNIAAYTPLHIVYDERSYDDNVNITSAEIYDRFYADGTLPKTAAISVGEYIDFFGGLLDEDTEIVHINIGSSLSCSHSNALLAAEQTGSVYVVDSQNLSSGIGLLVIEAAERIAAGMPARQVAEEVTALVPCSHASFVVDTLKFLAAGGRCSALAALGANLLKIKPSIEVDNQGGGAMSVAKKYRGKYAACVSEYVRDQLARYDNIRTDRVFMTHSNIEPEYLEAMRTALEEDGRFKEILDTSACCTIASHCGPNCIGVLFMTES